MEQNSITPTPPPVPAVPVIDYDAPRADLVPRRRYLGAVVVAATLGAAVLGLLSMRVVNRPSAGRAAMTLTTPPPAPVIVTPAAPSPQDIQRLINASRRDSNERRLQQLLGLRHAPTQVVYTEDPVEAKRLFGQGVCNWRAARSGISQPYWGAFEPPVYQTDGFYESNTADVRDAMLFAHQLTSPGGNRRLVVLDMEVKLAGHNLPGDEFKVELSRKLKYRICQPKLSGLSPDVVRDGTSLRIEQIPQRGEIPIKWVDGTLRSARPRGHNLRFFAGQADSNDPSHFTVKYELDGKKNVIDGWLTDDDFLRIVPRGGKVDKGTWRIDAAE